MAPLRCHKQPSGKIPANRAIADQRRELVIQSGMISSLMEQYVQDLAQPMTVILGLNELILPQPEAGHNLAPDLEVLTKQIKRMSQIVDEANNLVEKRKKLLKVLGALHLNAARFDGGGTGSYAMRKELT